MQPGATIVLIGSIAGDIITPKLVDEATVAGNR
jgi:hypothetical protein